MLKLGWDEIKIMKELGMTLEEVQRLMDLKVASEILGVPYSIERQIKEVEEDINDEID
jgi:DNA-binding transcriptional MerR regulator